MLWPYRASIQLNRKWPKKKRTKKRKRPSRRRIAIKEDALQEKKEEFGYVDTAPDPAKLASEVSRGDHRTWIKADRITELTCEVDGDSARGIVKYLVPKMVRGQIHYRTVKNGEEWQITGFIMPVHKIILTKKADGKRAQKEWKDKK